MTQFLKLLATLLCVLIFPWFNSYSQIQFGGHPPSLSWNQINTQTVKIIYPDGEYEKANRIANLINYIHAHQLHTVGSNSKKIDIVLQANQVISNGYVSLSPFRSEFFATPFQNNQVLGSVDWLDGLAIHEYRHALQFSNSNRWVTKFFHITQGQGGWAGSMFLAIPDWYFEGDAVSSETVLSSGGRGRNASFFKEQRALLLNDIDYSYMKARNGSYKDLVPSHYPLGFAIINYGRNQFGPDVWKKVLKDAGSYRTIIYPFSGAMKIHTGMRAPGMYKASYSELKEQWNKELNELQLTNHQSLTPKQKIFTNNSFPQYIDESSIVYLSASYKKTGAIYQLTNGQTKKITDVGSSVSPFLSSTNSILSWSEYERDPRWGLRNFTKIITYDLNTREKRVIARKTKFFSPEASPDGSKIVAARYTEELESNIVILNINDGSIEQVLPNPEDHTISYPSWSFDNGAIIYLGKKNSQLAIFKFNLSNDQISQLSPWTTHTIGKIAVGKDRVVYSASYTGIDNIFSIDLDGSQTITQLTSSRIGAYQPDISPEGTRIVFSEFTEMGSVLSSLEIEKSMQKIIAPIAPSHMERFNINLAEYEEDILDKIPDTKFEAKPYKGFLKGTKLHDWGISGGTSEVYARIGFTNILNDFNANLISGFNQNEDAFRYGVSAQYARYFPVINASAFNTDRNTVVLSKSDSTYFLDSFTQNKVSTGISIPLVWERGNYSTGLTITGNLAAYHLGSRFSLENSSEQLTSLELNLVSYNIRRRAYQNVQPRLGPYLLMYYSKSLSDIEAERFNAQMGLYIPGIGLNHGILIEGEYQKEDLSNTYQYSDVFNFARGYAYPYNDEVFRFSINYQLPLLYPDWGFFNFTYFKRVRLNMFYDIAKHNLFLTDFEERSRSFGGELILDNVMLNVLPISFVLRQSYLLDSTSGDSNTNFDFFIRIAL
ncbi:MAG: hypothetical protein ED557_07550 [Balneola sp.]|nr:MAG: hypothetical protein ED557_07550 [Balneola sp.]